MKEFVTDIGNLLKMYASFAKWQFIFAALLFAVSPTWNCGFFCGVAVIICTVPDFVRMSMGLIETRKA